MTTERKMLYQTLAGHFALLETAHPRKAATAVARKAQRHVKLTLRREGQTPRRQAA